LNSLFHSKTLGFFIISPPQASVSIAQVSFAYLTYFKETLMLILCSKNDN